MIIVKTKNGDRFINDKAVTMVEHDREKAVVNAYGDKGVFSHIEDVEEVIYTNNAQLTHRKDEGSDVYPLNEALAERYELKERLAQVESKVANEYKNDKLKDIMYYEIDRMDIQELIKKRKNHPEGGAFQKSGSAERFIHFARRHDIETVGQLLEVGRARFEHSKYLGRQCVERISEALYNLYGIKSW